MDNWRSIIKLALAVMLLGCATSATVGAQDNAFEMANQFYVDKDYASSIRLYESIVAGGIESANLYFNLGNAYFKSGDLGRAVLYYHRARRLSPVDQDIIDNLVFARRYARVQMEGVTLNPVSTFFSGIVGPYQLTQLAWFSSAIFVLFILLLCARFGLDLIDRGWRSIAVFLALLLFVSAGLTTFKYRQEYITERAVIIAEDSTVRTGPSEQSDLEFEGAPGLVVEILSESGNYYQVLFENKRRGWLQKDLVAVI